MAVHIYVLFRRSYCRMQVCLPSGPVRLSDSTTLEGNSKRIYFGEARLSVNGEIHNCQWTLCACPRGLMYLYMPTLPVSRTFPNWSSLPQARCAPIAVAAPLGSHPSLPCHTVESSNRLPPNPRLSISPLTIYLGSGFKSSFENSYSVYR